jgi:hypothetical protein
MEAAFLQALHADPTDEATWLALAKSSSSRPSTAVSFSG